MKYAKSVAAVVAAGVAALVAALSDNTVDASEWINVAVLVAGACNVFTAANVPGSKYIKAFLAVITAVLVLAVSLVSGGFTLVEGLQLLLAAAAAVGVYRIPNRGDALAQLEAQSATVNP